MPYNLRKRIIKEIEPPKKKARVVAKKETLVVAKKEALVVAKKEAHVAPKKEAHVAPKKEAHVAPKKEALVASKKEALVVSKKEALVAPKKETHVDPKKDLRKGQFVFGTDSCGEFGLKTTGLVKKLPVPVPFEEPVKEVVCGPMHSLTLTFDGQIYSYGCNDEGALGRVTEDQDQEATPEIVDIKSKVTKMTAGDSHSAVLTEDNEIYVWGNFRDEHGSVGLTTSCQGKPSFKPIQILPGTKFKDIASGSNHMLLLDVDGKVYSFGVGEQGQLGRLNPEESSRQITAENRELFLMPQEVSFENVDPQRPFVCDAIYAGNFSSFATNTDKKKNRLAGWGLNNYYQLGYKGTKGQLVQYFPRRSTFTCSTSMIGVACGQHHTLFLTKTGRVYAAGRHEYGMLGLGEVQKEVCPAKYVDTLKDFTISRISAGINTSFAASDEGKLYSWGMGGFNLGHKGEDDVNLPTEVTYLDEKKVLSVSAGSEFTSVVVEQPV